LIKLGNTNNISYLHIDMIIFMFAIMHILFGFIGSFIFRLSDKDFGIGNESISKMLINPLVIGGYVTFIISLIKMIKNSDRKDLI